MTKTLCDIFKSLKHDEMYLYVDHREGVERVPDALLNSFGKRAKVMTLPLSPERKLARADAGVVLASIAEKGYYLQMPPAKDLHQDDPMQALGARNEMLPRN